jgi:hypothetical protein
VSLFKRPLKALNPLNRLNAIYVWWWYTVPRNPLIYLIGTQVVVAEYAGPGTFALTLPVPRSRTRGAVHLKMTDARVRLPPLWGSLCWELARAPLWGSLCWELARAPL